MSAESSGTPVEMCDPVAKEYEIVVNKAFQDRLYLFQYPVRPKGETYEEEEILSTKVKPNQQRVEFEIGIDIQSKRYARSRGEQIAVNVDGKAKEANPFFPLGLMDKYILQSHPSSPEQQQEQSKRLCLAMVFDGKIILLPMKGLVQMRPSFVYLDKSDDRAKTKSAAEAADGASSQDEGEDASQLITVKFGRQESEEARKRRLNTYDNVMKRFGEEPWIYTRFFRSHEKSSQLLKAKMLQGYTQPDEGSLTVEQYLSKLQTPTEEVVSLADQIQKLIVRAKIVHFDELLELLPEKPDAATVLKYVQQYAVLIQGCWLAKSDLLYPDGSISRVTGVAAEHLRRARDFLLWLWVQKTVVTRKELASATKLPPGDVHMLLSEVGKAESRHGWKLALLPDEAFIRKHPDVFERQQRLWSLRADQFNQMIKIREGEGKSPRRKRSKSRTISEDDHYLAKPEPTEHLSAAATHSAGLSTTAVRTSDHLERVRSILRSRLIVPLKELAPLLEAGGGEALLHQAGGTILRNQWPEGATHEALCGLLRCDDGQDKMRETLYELFEKQTHFRLNKFSKLIEEKCGVPADNTKIRQFLKDYCVTMKGCHYLKETIPPPADS